jgi:DNA-binding transcriptional ArsR family regulator
MAFAKTDSFPKDIQEMAAFASALSHPARIALLVYLQDHPGCRCSELVKFLPLSQPSCSRHLGELRKAGLVIAHPTGSEIRYELNPQRIETFCDAFRSTLKPE